MPKKPRIRRANRSRALRARKALATYQKLRGGVAETDVDVSDLICDLMHLAMLEELDFKALAGRAVLNFEAEIRPDEIEIRRWASHISANFGPKGRAGR